MRCLVLNLRPSEILRRRSREHLARYCDEFAFRYENRKASDGERAKMLVLKAGGKRVTYKQPA